MKKMIIPSLVRPNVRSLRAYQAAEIPCSVKLDANESPYSAIRGKGASRCDSIPRGKPACRTGRGQEIYKVLNRYPDPEAKALRKLLAGE
ncbi:MAG: hypothetical protein HY758_04930, partial [Nitrospirae bacterium]|nr:hypothetical protein [Nitrospirota bacterium]